MILPGKPYEVIEDLAFYLGEAQNWWCAPSRLQGLRTCMRIISRYTVGKMWSVVQRVRNFTVLSRPPLSMGPMLMCRVYPEYDAVRYYVCMLQCVAGQSRKTRRSGITHPEPDFGLN